MKNPGLTQVPNTVQNETVLEQIGSHLWFSSPRFLLSKKSANTGNSSREVSHHPNLVPLVTTMQLKSHFLPQSPWKTLPQQLWSVTQHRGNHRRLWVWDQPGLHSNTTSKWKEKGERERLKTHRIEVFAHHVYLWGFCLFVLLSCGFVLLWDRPSLCRSYSLYSQSSAPSVPRPGLKGMPTDSSTGHTSCKRLSCTVY